MGRENDKKTAGLETILLAPEMSRILDIASERRRSWPLLLLNNRELENEVDMLVRGTEDPEEIRVQLIHNHLPKLAEAGYIEWDRDTGEISKGPRFDEIKPLLDLIQNHADELPPDWP